MFYYFGYGSNMDMTSLQAKGVNPVNSQRATLLAWKLAFDVHHFFRHEGGMGNIHPTQDAGAKVLGVVHLCADEELKKLDAVEAYGVGYDRVEIELLTDKSTLKAIAYVGIPSFLDANCLPTTRYLNILINGATHAGLEPDYINRLRNHPIHPKKHYPAFQFPNKSVRNFNKDSLAKHPHYTAIAGAVFDMSEARWEHEYLKGLFGAKDMTLWHLKRLDNSDGSETYEDIKVSKYTKSQQIYLNEYLHEYNQEYEYVGRYTY